MNRVILLLALAGCSKPVPIHWVLPEHGTLIITEERSTVTRTPEGLDEVTVQNTAVWRVTSPGIVGTDEVAWSEEVTQWKVTWEGRGGRYVWTPEDEDPLLHALSHLAPPANRTMGVMPDGTLWMRVAPEVSNADQDPGAGERRTIAQVPPWVAGLARDGRLG